MLIASHVTDREFWEKPLQGAVQWIVIGVLAYVLVALNRSRERILAKVAGAGGWRRIFLFALELFMETTSFIVPVWAGFGVHLSKTNAWRACAWAWLLGWGFYRTVNLMNQASTLRLRLLAEVKDDSAKVLIALSGRLTWHSVWRLGLLYVAEATGLYFALVWK